MEHAADTAQMLSQLTCPAFTVKNGIITSGNQAALQRQLQLNTDITDLICIGKDEYAMYTQGKLCLTLCIQNIQYHATVTAMQDCHLFCLASDYESPELRALALAAQQLREPLSKAMVGTDLLMPKSAVREDPEATQYLAQVNRSLHQLLRAVCNMSDAAHYAESCRCNMQMIDATAVFKEVLDKAASLAAQTERVFNYSVPNQAIYCMADQEKLERAILNLLSNAMKFTPKGSTIDINLQQIGNRLFFTVENRDATVDPKNNMFARYLREPGIEDGRNGIGLGLSIVHSVAAAHGGTVLIQQPENGGVKITMAMPINQSSENILRMPIKLPIDYAGGHDRCLLELSDVLPDSLFLDNM